MRVFKRQIRVTIRDTVIITNPLVIYIEIKKEASSSPGEGAVNIYNLNETTETLIRNRTESIQVEAGYDGRLNTILVGQIRRVERDREGLDRVTKITVGGHVENLTGAIFSRSYAGTVPTRTVVRDALNSIGLTTAPVDIIPASATLTDFTWSARATDALDQILRPLGLYWYEDDGVVRVSRPGSPTVSDIVVLNSQTGLVGTPSITDEGVKATSFLNPAIVVGGTVQITAESLTSAASGTAQSGRAAESQGFYKVTQLVHKGDNWDGDFLTELVATPVTNES